MILGCCCHRRPGEDLFQFDSLFRVNTLLGNDSLLGISPTQVRHIS